MIRRWLFTRDALCARAALLEDGRLVEYYEEPSGIRTRRGSIFAGIVRDVVPAISAAFVEVGPGEKVFLQFSESDLLPQAGDRELVQITQCARATKAPQATREIKLAGRFVVLVGGSNYVGVSKRITDKVRRDELRALLEAKLEQYRLRGDTAGQQAFGAIVRSLATEADVAAMEAELNYLLQRWREIPERFTREQQARNASPALLYEESSLPLRLLRDRVKADDQVLVDDKGLFDEAAALLARMRTVLAGDSSGLLPCLEFFAGEDASLFECADIRNQAREAGERQVMLAGGGSIVIDPVEALCAIDVNSGSSVGASSLEETAFETNCEAAVEVARQLRLRNTAGVVIVDFIEMRDSAHAEELMRLFAEELARDPARVRLLPLDELGLAKLTRKKQ